MENIKTADKSSVSETKGKATKVGLKETDESKAYYKANIVNNFSVVNFSCSVA